MRSTNCSRRLAKILNSLRNMGERLFPANGFCHNWVANFDSEAPALNRKERGASPWQPTSLRPALRGYSSARHFASVVKLLSSSASNGELAGGSPAGCANFIAALVQLPEALRSERRGWGWKSLTRHQPSLCELRLGTPSRRAVARCSRAAPVAQRRGGGLKPRSVSVQI